MQILRFGLVGVWNTVFDLGLFFTFYRFLNGRIRKDVRIKIETIAHICSFMIANFVSYQLNSRFTFNSDQSSSRQFLPYMMISLVSLGLSSAIINFLAKDMYFEKATQISKKYLSSFTLKRPQYALLIKAFAVTVVMAINYTGYKYIVFGG